MTKNEKSKDYRKADLKQRVLFFITIFRLADDDDNNDSDIDDNYDEY